jgi:peptidoglycan/xylan/chitin deacetylase (PgdA/CDA1 family)
MRQAMVKFPSIALALLWLSPAVATAQCAPGALGTSRTLAIDTHKLVGAGSYPLLGPLPLKAGEYVLTFDDGPAPGLTQAKLDILAKECIHATYFMIGAHAQSWPQLVRQVLAGGHTIGSHSMTHSQHLPSIPLDAAMNDITGGYQAVETAAYGKPLPPNAARLFRFPFDEDSKALLAWTHSHNISVIGSDLSPGDWRGLPPTLTFLDFASELNRNDRGIVLLHDNQANTVKLLPMIIAELKKRHLKIVHLVPQ